MSRSKLDNEALVQKHLAALPAYKRDDIFRRVLKIANNATECDDAVRNLCESK
jgi:hypothetical protein